MEPTSQDERVNLSSPLLEPEQAGMDIASASLTSVQSGASHLVLAHDAEDAAGAVDSSAQQADVSWAQAASTSGGSSDAGDVSATQSSQTAGAGNQLPDHGDFAQRITVPAVGAHTLAEPTAKVSPTSQTSLASAFKHGGSYYSTDRPGGPREMTGNTSFSLEINTPSLAHTNSFYATEASAHGSPASGLHNFRTVHTGQSSSRSHATGVTDIDDSVSSTAYTKGAGTPIAFQVRSHTDDVTPAWGQAKADSGMQPGLDEMASATAPQAYPSPRESAHAHADSTGKPMQDTGADVEAGGIRGAAGPYDSRSTHVVHLEDSDDDDDDELHRAQGTGRREPLKFCDYAGCLTLGFLATVGAGILWSRTVKGGQVEDNELLRWSIAATIVAVLSGYCVWLCVMTSKFEALQAEWDEEAGGGAGSGRAPSVFNCKEDCRNPAVGTCKLLVLVVGGVVMLPLFIVPYVFAKGALRSCRCCCQHCCVPCLEGFFNCMGKVYNSCLVPCCESVQRVLLSIWQGVCVPIYTHVVRPLFVGVWNTMAWIFNNVVTPVFNFVYEGARCIVNSITQLCSCIYNHVLLPIGRGIRAAGRCVLNSVLRPVWHGLRSAVSCLYNSVILPVARFLHGYIIMPVWRALLCFYNHVLLNLWRYVVVWPLQRIADGLRWVFGTCFPAIGRALACVFRTLVSTPAAWLWRNAVSPLLHYLFVVPWRYAVMPVLRGIGTALSAVARAISAALAAVGRFFASVGRALTGGGRR